MFGVRKGVRGAGKIARRRGNVSRLRQKGGKKLVWLRVFGNGKKEQAVRRELQNLRRLSLKILIRYMKKFTLHRLKRPVASNWALLILNVLCAGYFVI